MSYTTSTAKFFFSHFETTRHVALFWNRCRLEHLHTYSGFALYTSIQSPLQLHITLLPNHFIHSPNQSNQKTAFTSPTTLQAAVKDQPSNKASCLATVNMTISTCKSTFSASDVAKMKTSLCPCDGYRTTGNVQSGDLGSGIM